MLKTRAGNIVGTPGPADTFLSSSQVQARYGGVSYMWLYRREHEEGGTFPKPIRINGRRFWRLSDLVAYERSLASAA
jgi:predicted DNA-binding transcriptional regulator AlpA